MNNSWIDISVVSAMEYFAGVLATAYSWMHRSAMIFGTFGLLWSGFKLIFSRMSVKDFFWDTMFKWIAFLFLMGAYPLAVNAFMAIGSEIGMRAGAGKQIIIDGLTNLRNALRTDLTNAQELAKDAEL